MADADFVEINTSISEPTIQEIREYACWLGADLETDQDLFYIAKEALLADLPADWKLYQKKDGSGEPFYFNLKTGESIWDHPLDKYYKELFQTQKELKKKRQIQDQKQVKPNKPAKSVKKVHLPTCEKTHTHNQIKLSFKCLKQFPFQTLNKDFTFIVNGTSFQTSKLVSDLLSPIISKIHITDPTFDHFEVNTTHKGDFNYILNLFNFEYNQIPYDQIPFVTEIIELFETNSIKSNFHKRDVITIYNVVELLKQHEQFVVFFQNRFKKEIDFIASHFYQIFELNKEEEVKSLSLETIELIISHPNLVLKSEDQLLNFVNDLYSSNPNFSILYEYVDFLNTSNESTNDFLNAFKFEYFNRNIWNKILLRLQHSNIKSGVDKLSSSNRYYFEINKTDFLFDGINGFKGILTKIGRKVEITASSIFSESVSPQNVIDFSNNKTKYFSSQNSPNSWICFDFKNISVSLYNYSLQSDFSESKTIESPKSWVIEGSNDKDEWSIIDQKSDVVFTNQKRFLHTFTIQDPNKTPFRFIRMKMTDSNWNKSNFLKFGSIELFGKLYEKK